jgi:hypothetical protein
MKNQHTSGGVPSNHDGSGDPEYGERRNLDRQIATESNPLNHMKIFEDACGPRVAKQQQTCAEDWCNVHSAPGDPHYKGKQYCQTHYWAVLTGELNATHAAWNNGQDVPERFKYLLGRISEEQDWAIEGESYLSAARIRDRGWSFTKTKAGCVFCITRHPGAFIGAKVRPVVQTWEADITGRVLRLTETRPWRKNDPDL